MELKQDWVPKDCKSLVVTTKSLFFLAVTRTMKFSSSFATAVASIIIVGTQAKKNDGKKGDGRIVKFSERDGPLERLRDIGDKALDAFDGAFDVFGKAYTLSAKCAAIEELINQFSFDVQSFAIVDYYEEPKWDENVRIDLVSLIQTEMLLQPMALAFQEIMDNVVSRDIESFNAEENLGACMRLLTPVLETVQARDPLN